MFDTYGDNEAASAPVGASLVDRAEDASIPAQTGLSASVRKGTSESQTKKSGEFCISGIVCTESDLARRLNKW